MNTKLFLLRLLWLIGLFSSLSSFALNTPNMLMVRIEQSFPETMSVLQQSIKQQGYTVSRVQHVDVGLKAMGFKTDKYRVVFFGKGKQIEELSHSYPELIPYLPLKVAIFSEADDTLLVSTNPLVFGLLYPDTALQAVFIQWNKDIIQIFKRVQISD